VTERVFADYKHKTAVPSPDAYFKDDHLRRNTEEEYGLAFNAAKNSEFKSCPGRTIHKEPSRFDPLIDLKDSQRPGPTSYSPTDSIFRRSKSFKKSLAIRMAPNRYDTDVPGVGTYRT